MSRDKKDFRLIKPSPPERAEVDAGAAELTDLLGGGALGAADHEAILAMVLGDELAEITDAERAEADALARALDGEGDHAFVGLAAALRQAHGAGEGELAPPDHEALLALGLGTELPAMAPEGAHDELAEALRAAHRPRPLDAGDGDALLALGLGVEAAESAPMGAHRALREMLRAAADPAPLDETDGQLLVALTVHEGDLEAGDADAARFAASLTGDDDHELLGLAETLRAADGRGRPLDPFTSERLLRERLRRVAPRRPWVAALVAVAAALVLYASFGVGSRSDTVARLGPAPEFVEVHSTAALFDPAEPFAAKGGESDRMNRIVQARAADLRHNRFAAWGVE